MKPPADSDAPAKPVDLETAWSAVLQALGAPPAEEAREGNPFAGEAPIPVIILTGFLGAGKTTLLLELLQEGTLKIQAIVNDLAALNIDTQLVASAQPGALTLENGCACCDLGQDLEALLSAISSRASPPEAIVLEATGVADPMGLAASVARTAGVTLDGILTLVDSTRLASLGADPATGPLLQRQLDAAHLVLLTHGEDAASTRDAQAALGTLAPGRPVLALQDLPRPLSTTLLGARTLGARPTPPNQPHALGAFSSIVLYPTAPWPQARLLTLLNAIPEAVYRVKGWIFVATAEGSSRFQLQAMGRRWRLEPADPQRAEEDSSGLVVLGRAEDPAFTAFSQALAHLDESTRG